MEDIFIGLIEYIRYTAVLKLECEVYKPVKYKVTELSDLSHYLLTIAVD